MSGGATFIFLSVPSVTDPQCFQFSFADADIKLAAEAAALGITFNSGQVCAAGSRVYIQKSIEAEFLPIFKAAITSVISGKLSALDTNIGAMADAIQGKAVTDYIEVGKSEATLLLGGGRISSAEVRFLFFICITQVISVSSTFFLITRDGLSNRLSSLTCPMIRVSTARYTVSLRLPFDLLTFSFYYQEVFGPVLVLHTFETEEEVLRRANDSEYG